MWMRCFGAERASESGESPAGTDCTASLPILPAMGLLVGYAITKKHTETAAEGSCIDECQGPIGTGAAQIMPDVCSCCPSARACRSLSGFNTPSAGAPAAAEEVCSSMLRTLGPLPVLAMSGNVVLPEKATNTESDNRATAVEAASAAPAISFEVPPTFSTAPTHEPSISEPTASRPGHPGLWVKLGVAGFEPLGKELTLTELQVASVCSITM
jgi:hypothetical protein